MEKNIDIEYYVYENDISIKDSYKVSKHDFITVLTKIKKEYPTNNVIVNRTFNSFIKEWSVHNFLYSLGLWKKRTRTVDLNYPQKFKEKIVYFIFGWICWVFIK